MKTDCIADVTSIGGAGGNPLLDEAPRSLSELEEQLHTLLSVHNSEGRCIAKFPNGDFIFPEELGPQLRPLVGHKIACLRLDGQYYVRDLEAKNAA